MTFIEKRNLITQALVAIGIDGKNINYSKDIIPRSFPAVLVVLQGEQGKNPTSRQFCSFEYNIEVFLIADVNNSNDPDTVILTLSDKFKSEYRELMKQDIPRIEFYPARADAGRKVRIAKVYTVSE